MEDHLKKDVSISLDPKITAIMKNFVLSRGWGNGYILVDKSHDWYGKDYDNINAEVHGGLTFSESFTSRIFEKWVKNQNIRYSKDMEDVIANNGYGAFKDFWIIGFDTGHAGDNPQTCDIEYVWRETKNLYKQYLGVTKNQRLKKLKNINKTLRTGNKG